MAKLYRPGTILCYLAVACLLAFYLITLWRSLNPHPSLEYQAFYLDQILAFWPGEDGLEVSSGQTLVFSDEIGSGQGAGHLGRDQWKLENGKWQTTGQSAAIYLTGSGDVSLTGTLTLQGEKGQQVLLSVSGQPEVISATLTGGSDMLTIPCTLSSDSLVALQLEIAAGGPVEIQELTFQ